MTERTIKNRNSGYYLTINNTTRHSIKLKNDPFLKRHSIIFPYNSHKKYLILNNQNHKSTNLHTIDNKSISHNSCMKFRISKFFFEQREPKTRYIIKKGEKIFWLRKIYIILPNNISSYYKNDNFFFNFYYPIKDFSNKYKKLYSAYSTVNESSFNSEIFCTSIPQIFTEIKKFLGINEYFNEIKMDIYDEDFNLIENDHYLMRKSEKDKFLYVKITQLSDEQIIEKNNRCKFHKHKIDDDKEREKIALNIFSNKEIKNRLSLQSLLLSKKKFLKPESQKNDELVSKCSPNKNLNGTERIALSQRGKKKNNNINSVNIKKQLFNVKTESSGKKIIKKDNDDEELPKLIDHLNKINKNKNLDNQNKMIESFLASKPALNFCKSKRNMLRSRERLSKNKNGTISQNNTNNVIHKSLTNKIEDKDKDNNQNNISHYSNNNNYVDNIKSYVHLDKSDDSYNEDILCDLCVTHTNYFYKSTKDFSTITHISPKGFVNSIKSNPCIEEYTEK